jgi:outer membrane receptor for ferrienterochelin and colicins
MTRKHILTLGGLAMSYALMAGTPVVPSKSAKLGVDSVLNIDQVVVTATRTPKALKDVPVVTQVIGLKDIQRSDATNIQDLLINELPGLEFSYAMSQETSLNMNGVNGSAMLFLVDGERLAGETMDNIDYTRLNLDNIGRVEIVKGAASALYGANAVGGVVNLISRENTEPWTLNLNSRYMSEGNNWRNGIRTSFKQGRWNSQTSVQHTCMNTVQLTDAFDTKSNIQNLWGNNTLNVKERLIFNPIDKLKLIARGGYFNRHSKRSNYTDNYKDYTAGLRSIYELKKGGNIELSYAYDQYDKARYVNEKRTHDHDYSNRQHVIHALINLPLNNNILTFGADFLHDYLTTYQFKNNEAKRQQSYDAFLQFDYNPAKWLNIVASVRNDYFSASHSDATTARLATMLKFTGFSIRGSYAGGFRAPTLKEMYMNFDMAGIMMIYGNENLKPERSNNYNLALEHYGTTTGWLEGSYSVTLSGYINKYNKRITTTDYAGDNNNDAGEMYCNDDGVTISGIDFNAKYRTKLGIDAGFVYNYLHASANSVTSQFSQPRPHSMTWHLDYEKQLQKNYLLSTSISGRYLSRPKTQAETCGAYSLWKATIMLRIMKAFKLTAVIDNLFGYTPKTYYWNSPTTKGRTFSIGLSIDVDKIKRSLSPSLRY